jgi:hypothetical protein
MTAKAHIRFDYMSGGVEAAIRREAGGGQIILRWHEATPEFVPFDGDGRVPEVNEAGTPWLRLQEDDARALYEALADYYGHAAADVRLLRNDYEAERRRVDKFIDSTLATRSNREQ